MDRKDIITHSTTQAAVIEGQRERSEISLQGVSRVDWKAGGWGRLRVWSRVLTLMIGAGPDLTARSGPCWYLLPLYKQWRIQEEEKRPPLRREVEILFYFSSRDLFWPPIFHNTVWNVIFYPLNRSSQAWRDEHRHDQMITHWTHWTTQLLYYSPGLKVMHYAD